MLVTAPEVRLLPEPVPELAEAVPFGWPAPAAGALGEHAVSPVPAAAKMSPLISNLVFFNAQSLREVRDAGHQHAPAVN
jgi:hypothetical protein